MMHMSITLLHTSPILFFGGIYTTPRYKMLLLPDNSLLNIGYTLMPSEVVVDVLALLYNDYSAQCLNSL